ncbi:MAG: PPC domain-containing protein [Rivularia sp. (in: cyanobacteria)]|jgi:hypothetical protein
MYNHAIDNDYYCFSLGSTSEFQLDLLGLTGDADVQLLNSNGSINGTIILPPRIGSITLPLR